MAPPCRFISRAKASVLVDPNAPRSICLPVDGVGQRDLTGGIAGQPERRLRPDVAKSAFARETTQHDANEAVAAGRQRIDQLMVDGIVDQHGSVIAIHELKIAAFYSGRKRHVHLTDPGQPHRGDGRKREQHQRRSREDSTFGNNRLLDGLAHDVSPDQAATVDGVFAATSETRWRAGRLRHRDHRGTGLPGQGLGKASGGNRGIRQRAQHGFWCTQSPWTDMRPQQDV